MYQPPYHTDRQETEVAEINYPPRHQAEKELVGDIADPEPKPLRALCALRQYHVFRIFIRRCQQHCNISRPILAVAVHDYNGVDILTTRNERQADRNGPLVTEVDGKLDHLDRVDAALDRKDRGIVRHT